MVGHIECVGRSRRGKTNTALWARQKCVRKKSVRKKALEECYEILQLLHGVRARTGPPNTMSDVPETLTYVRRKRWMSQIGEVRAQVGSTRQWGSPAHSLDMTVSSILSIKEKTKRRRSGQWFTHRSEKVYKGRYSREKSLSSLERLNVDPGPSLVEETPILPLDKPGIAS